MKKFISALCLILSISFLIPFLAPTVKGSDSAPSLDFSDPDSAFRSEISPSRLLGLISPELSFTTTELDYIDKYIEPMLLSNRSSAKGIEVVLGENTLTLSAEPRSYTAKNGTPIKVTPISAKIGGIEYPLTLSEGKYRLTLTDIDTSEITVIPVFYSLSFRVPEETCDHLLNFVYREAEKAKALEEEYNAVFGEYLEKYAAYVEYLNEVKHYEESLEAYEKYLSLKAEYDAAYAGYLEYLSELSEYEAEEKKYQKYLSDYSDYQAKKAEYDRIYNENIGVMDEYLAYYNKVDSVRASMYAIENLFTKPNNGTNNLFMALQNKEMVKLFEEKKSILSIYGVSKATIDSLSSVSDELNDLLNGYAEKREISEEEAFSYYKANYTAIRDKFNYLYNTMCEILMNATLFNHICTAIDAQYSDKSMAEYKKWRIGNVLCHIYLITKCLDDNALASGSWSFYNYEGRPHIYYFPDILASNVIISDTNGASPEGLEWPSGKPNFTLPAVPKEPEAVAKPPKPHTVEEPTAPTPVERPTEPTAVPDPGTPPAKLDGILAAAPILELVDSGRLRERDVPTGGCELSFTYKVEKHLSAEGGNMLTVYDGDLSVIHTAPLTDASSFVLPDLIPEKSRDRKSNYTFSGWSLSETELVAPVYREGEDIEVFALFDAEERYYTITWTTCRGSYTTRHRYNEIPSAELDLTHPETETKTYSFGGWMPVISAVREDTEYKAVYTESERKYKIEFDVLGKVTETEYSYMAEPTPPDFAKSVISGCELLTFREFDSKIFKVTENKKYTALFDRTVLVSTNSGSVSLGVASNGYSVTADTNEVRAYELIRLAAKEGKRIDVTLPAGSIAIEPSEVMKLSKAGGDGISLATEKTGETLTGFTLEITDKNGKALAQKAELRLRISYGGEKTPFISLCAKAGEGALKDMSYSVSGGNLSLSTEGYTEFIFVRLYTVTVSEVEGGAFIPDKTLLAAGDGISGGIYPAIGQIFDSIIVKRADNGEEIIFRTVEAFVMPPCDVTVTPNFRQRTYTVAFVVDGETVSSEQYPLGEMPTIPKISEEYEADGYKYIFAGWSQKVSSVTGDVVYTAKYTRILISDAEEPDNRGNAFLGLLKYTVLPIAAIGLAILAVIMVLVLLLKRRKIGKGR